MHDILLVEDNDLSRNMLSRRLKRSGYSVTTAATGVEAIAKVTAEHPDVVLMDMSLPELDGWECTRRLRAQEPTRDIHIVALTAHAMQADRRRALAVGCDDYLTKPIDFPTLLQTIERLLAESPVTPRLGRDEGKR